MHPCCNCCEVKGELGPSLGRFSLVSPTKTRCVFGVWNGDSRGGCGEQEGSAGCRGAAGKALGETVSENNCQYLRHFLPLMVLACQQVYTSTALKAKLQLYFYLCCQVYMQLGIYHTLLLSVNNTKSGSLIISITTIVFHVEKGNKQLKERIDFCSAC